MDGVITCLYMAETKTLLKEVVYSDLPNVFVAPSILYFFIEEKHIILCHLIDGTELLFIVSYECSGCAYL